MRDLPSGPQLLALARTVLLDELMPMLPPERRIDGLLVASCLAIAEREATAAAPVTPRELALFYRSAGAPPTDDASFRPGETEALWQRFAGDLRRGVFEGSHACERQVRAILWQLTLTRLRLANPKFLNANGLA